MLKEINISVEVHCDRPEWARLNPDPKYNDVKYRLYVGDDLITERNWIWDNNTYLNENIWIMTEDLTNTVSIQSVLLKHDQAKFSVKNLRINNYAYSIDSTQDTAIQFTTINT